MTLQKSPSRTAMALVVGVTLGGAMLVGGLAGSSLGVDLPNWAILATAAVAGSIGAWASLRYWRRIDEAAREAHKSAWYWGGQAGMVAAMLLVLALYLETGKNGLGLFEAGLMTGVGLAFGLMAIGYLAAWAVWWFRHR